MGVVQTVHDVVTDTKKYYRCPRCNREVWAYGSFVGNVCLDCPGTVISAVGSTANMATFEATRPVSFLLSAAAPAITTIAKAPIDLITGDKAEFKGSTVWKISKGNVWNILSSKNNSEIIKSITTKSCGIRWGLVDNTIVEHWWMNIVTNCSYYQIQFRGAGSQIVIRKCCDISDCDETGLAEACRDDDVQPILQNSYSYNGD
eukprot:282553_1